MQFIFSLLFAALLLPAPAFAQDQESWSAHFQATYIRQVQPAFHSDVEGPHSLRADAGASYSLTATAALGLRLGPSTELYVDPEAVQGVPLSGLFGLAAFPNGELAKTSGATLKLYRARLFVRHTFELGGEAVDVDSDANQLKSRHDARRLVVTAGNVSVLDLFDASSYSHDPRTQFMNWSLMTYGAYDYPADARGYTNGVAVDCDDGPWTLRAGRWSRATDTVGLAVGSDALSDGHREYLARGGLTNFLGDGSLRYGRERMAELYYRADIGRGFALTADVQRVANPGYNRDHGPAAFYAVRLHWES